jgi:Fic family protein
MSTWIWQQKHWPALTWQEPELAPLLRETTQALGRLLGKVESSGAVAATETSLDALLQTIVSSAAIEGETLNAASVRSSLAKRLRLAQVKGARTDPASEGFAELMLDATGNPDAPLNKARLLQWHRWLFPPETQSVLHPVRVGAWRGPSPMRVVSGRIDKPVVHFQAPPRKGLDAEMKRFFDWFESSRHDDGLDPLLRAGIAHFWLVTLHPFDDGNGRIARAVADLALAQAWPATARLHAMSAAILANRSGYYDILEATQRGPLDVTAWLQWFLETLLHSLRTSQQRIDRVLAKTRFWHRHRESALSPEQCKVVNRLLDGEDFLHGISASQYQVVAKVSKATATRHLGDLLEKGVIEKLPGGGRSTRYRIRTDE